jgi:hypothetical protein
MRGRSKKMNTNNHRHRRYIPLYCSRPTQTHSGSEGDAEFSDFPSIKIGKSISPTSAVRRGSQKLPLPNEKECPSNTGLGRSNILNMVDAATPPERLGKVTPSHHTLFAGI